MLSDLPRPGVTRRSRRPWDADQSPARTATELELEQVIARLASLVLGAHALAERMSARSGGSAAMRAARAERVGRLRAAVDLGQRAIPAAVCYAADRRRADRRLRNRRRRVERRGAVRGDRRAAGGG